MQVPLKDKNDIKIFILYLMRHINYPLEFSNINDIVVQDGVVGYFDFAECFAELLDTGNVAEIKVKNTDMYIITDRGIQVADSLESRLLGMLKEKSLKSALRLLDFKKRGSEIRCSYEPTDDGRYRFNCYIKESGVELLSLSIYLDTQAQAEKMKYNFDDRPETVYRGILALLSGEVNYLID